MYAAADLAMARLHVAQAEARLARVKALVMQTACDGNDKLAEHGAKLVEVLTATLGLYEEHARAIADALSTQRREGLN